MMGLVYTVCVLFVIGGVWYNSAAKMEKDGRGWFVRNLISGSAGTFLGVVVIVAFAADGWLWNAIGFGITGLVVKLFVVWEHKPASSASPPNIPSSPAAPVQSAPSAPQAVAALHRDAPIEDPLANWKRTAAAEPSAAIADIEFDYEDARGNRSHRTVSVSAVDAEYFEGFCHKALETRTFVIGRVRGKVTVCDTGEVLPAKKWAAEVRRDPRNGAVTMDGSPRQVDDDIEGVEPAEIGAEILFTGFPKDQRAQLEQLAEDFGMTVRKSVTQGLSYLCAGPNAGPAKLAQALEAGVEVIDSEAFFALLK